MNDSTNTICRKHLYSGANPCRIWEREIRMESSDAMPTPSGNGAGIDHGNANPAQLLERALKDRRDMQYQFADLLLCLPADCETHSSQRVNMLSRPLTSLTVRSSTTVNRSELTGQGAIWATNSLAESTLDCVG